MSNGIKINDENWLDFDRKHVWHPYSSMIDPPATFPVVAADGVQLELEDGRKLIDGMASWWSAIHGYNHPVLNRAVTEQLEKMSHVMFGGLTHPKAVELCQLLVELTPQPLQQVFLCDSGSVSVEIAIKMAIQYWYVKGRQQKNRLLTIRNGYHGDTFGAMAVCDPVGGMHQIYSHLVPQHLFADAPQARSDEEWFDEDIESFRTLMAEHHQEVAAVILEPVVQGAGGMRFYAPEYLRQVRDLCDRYNVLLIADEIATGFGRSGKLFACEHAGISPDILCLGKGLTGGYMTLAATLSTEKVTEVLSSDSPGVFMHGPTFMGNPLACAVAVASIRLLLESDWQGNVRRIEAKLEQGLAPCRELDCVADVRLLGAIGVVELQDPVDMRSIQPKFVDKGVWVRPFGKLVYVMPPYIISDNELEFLAGAIRGVLEEEYPG